MIRTVRDLLEDHRFFRGLDGERLDLLAGCGRLEVFRPQARLLREGQPADRFFLVRSGRVLVEIDLGPRGVVPVETVGAGDVLGWSWIVPPYRYRFDAVATALTRTITMDGACLRDKCEQDPALGYDLLRRFAGVLAHRLAATRMQLCDVYGYPLAGAPGTGP